MRWFLAAGLCAGLLAVALVGCGPQLKVAKDNMVEWVNRQLGELDVKKAEFEEKITAANAGLKNLRTARITAEVKMEAINKELKPIEEQLTAYKEAMKLVRTDIKEVQATNTPITKGGQTYDLKKLNDTANDLISKYNKLTKEKERKEGPRAYLAKQHGVLVQKEADFVKKLDSMKEDLEDIKGKMDEVKSFRSVAASLGDADASIDENFTKIRDEMNEFKGKLDVVLRTESGEFEEAAKAIEKVDAAEKYIEASTTKADPVSSLDDILGKDSN